MKISDMSAISLSKAIKNHEISVKEVLDQTFETIENKDKELNSFISLCKDEAYAKGEKIQEKIDAGEDLSVLMGVPIAVKDNICTKGISTTCASNILKNFKPTYNATAVEKIEAAGLIVVGKTNMDEFAMGSTSETSAFGAPKNPYDTNKVSGGSSGGSCVAVAGGLVLLALGSDTGGSIRQPSAYCNVFGIKPTYGRVSRYGLIAYASSLDQIGPIARNLEDASELLKIIEGKDFKDSTSVEKKLDTKPLDQMKVGIPEDYLLEGLDDEMREKVFETAKKLEEQGVTVEKFKLGYGKYVVPAYYVIACAEASSNLERFDGVKYGYRTENYEELHSMYKKTRSEGFGSEVKRRIMLGSFVLSSGYYDAYYLKALKAKALIKKAFDEAFEKYDAILSPVTTQTAPKIGTSLDDPIKMYLSDIYTVSANLCSLPAVAFPTGTDKDGMPIGLQFIGDCFAEDKCIELAGCVK